MYQLGNTMFVLGRISLVRAACPRELMCAPGNSNPALPLVVVQNRTKVGYVAGTGYTPPAVVVSGGILRQRLLEAGMVRSWAMVEKDAMEIKAEDQIGSAELLSRLDTLILDRVLGAGVMPISGQPWPYIVEVYPFENTLSYMYKGQRYRQQFALDPAERKISLRGSSVIALDACGGISEHGETMPRVETGMQQAHTARGNDQTSHRGASRSELITQVVRNWSNILGAVHAYLEYAKTRGTPTRPPMKPSFAPVQLSEAGKIVAVLAKAGIDAFDFAVWSVGAQAQHLAAKAAKAQAKKDTNAAVAVGKSKQWGGQREVAGR